MEILWWHWAVGGLVLILAELFIPSFVLIWFGLGALVVALALLLISDLPLTAQLALWLVVSLVLVVFWFKLFHPARHKTRIGMSDANVIGEIGLLTRDVAAFQKGEVRFQKPVLGSEAWPCLCEEAIPAGSRVRITAVEGSFVRVAKL